MKGGLVPLGMTPGSEKEARKWEMIAAMQSVLKLVKYQQPQSVSGSPGMIFESSA